MKLALCPKAKLCVNYLLHRKLFTFTQYTSKLQHKGSGILIEPTLSTSSVEIRLFLTLYLSYVNFFHIYTSSFKAFIATS